MLDRLDRCGEPVEGVPGTRGQQAVQAYLDAVSKLKGVDRMGALTYAATMDDFSRFRNGSVSKCFDLTPTRHGSSEKVAGTAGYRSPATPQ